MDSHTIAVQQSTHSERKSSGAARGGRGEASPYGWTSKNYVLCVCFHCHGTSSYHTTNTLQGRRAKSHVDTQTIQPGLGDSRPPINPYLTSPLLQNPGGATAKVCRKITINDEMNLFFKLQSLFGTFIHTYIQIYTAPKIVRTNLSFLRVLFDKISSVHCVCIL